MTPGHHYLMVVQPKDLQKALQLYQQVKVQSPQDTSLVLVTQASVLSEFASLRTWKELQPVPSSSLVHPGRARKWAAVTDYQLPLVGSDEADEPTVEFKSGGHVMAVDANLAGSVHTILLDSGASGTAYITQAFVLKLGLPIVPLRKAQRVQVGDGNVVQGLGSCMLPLRLGTLKCKVQCLVMPKLPLYPLILGDPWLQAFQAEISYATHTVTLTNPQGKSVRLQSTNHPKVAGQVKRTDSSTLVPHSTLAELCEELGVEIGSTLSYSSADIPSIHPSIHPSWSVAGGWLSGCKRTR